MRNIFVIIFFFFSLLSFAADKPNIVFILVDDLGWVDVSTGNSNESRGSIIYQTPNIDRIADEGMSFTHAYTQQNCSPTRASLLTGLYPTDQDNGVFNVTSLARDDNNTLKPILITPPEQQNKILSTGVTMFDMANVAGYTSCFVGKDHGTGASDNIGVDVGVAVPGAFSATVGGEQVQSYYFALNSDTDGWTFNGEGIDQYALPYTSEYVNSKLQPVVNGNNLALLPGTAKHQTDAIGDFCEDYIRDEAVKDKPFFLYVPFHAVHYKIAGRPDLVAKYLDKGYNAALAEYAAMIETVDQNIGRIYMALKDPNGDGDPSDDVSDNTIFILYSDNGGVKGNGPLTGGKGTFTEGGIRVPLMVKYPGVIQASSISNQAIHAIDFFPTLAEIMGVDIASLKKDNGEIVDLDGVSIAQILTGKQVRLDRENLFWHFPGYMGNRQRPNSMIHKRIGDDYYKLRYYYESGKSTLHHINSDISEQRDLLEIQDPRDVQLARQMLEELKHWLMGEKAATGTWKLDGSTVQYPDSLILSELKKEALKIDTIRWTKNEDFKNWVIKQGIDSLEISDEKMKVYFQKDGAGRSEIRIDNINITTSIYDQFRIVAKNQSENTEFRFSHHATNAWYDARKETGFFTASDSAFRSYTLDLNGPWISLNGLDPISWEEAVTVDNVIIRLANKIPGSIDIDTMEFLPTNMVSRNITLQTEGGGALNFSSGSCVDGQSLGLVATPDNGNEFIGWTGDTVSAQNPLKIIVDSDLSLTAIFRSLPAYTLNIVTDKGRVVKAPDQDNYFDGTIVKLTATADEGYEFSAWTGDLTGTNSIVTLRLDSSINITANFIPSATYKLDVIAENGSVIKSPEQNEYIVGTEVRLSALANEGYEFVGWSGDTISLENPINLRVDSAMNITANFTLISSLDKNNDGSLIFSIYPNPTPGAVTVSSKAEGISSYRIFTMNGSEVQSGSFESDIVIEIEKTGIYIIFLQGLDEVKTQKLVVM